MQVIVSVTRKVQYSSIVEMPHSKFKLLKDGLDSDNRELYAQAERDINKLVDTKDWQDDELDCIDEFKKLEEA